MTLSIIEDLATALDPVLLAQSLDIDPDPWQREVLLSTEKRIQILAARQSGKSTICAVYALWHAFNNQRATVLVLSPSLRQSGLLFQTIMDYYQALGRPIPSEVESSLTLQIANKSKIISLPGLERTIRGYSGVTLLVLDECALIPDELYYSVRPMLAVSRGRILAIGTPHGKRGWFYETWTNSDEFKKIKITADQCPRISKEFLDQERKALGRYWFEQEYFCEFHQNEAALFDYDIIRRAVRDDVEELDLDLDFNEE